MEDEFYAAIKLVSGEEIFALVCASIDEDRTLLLMDNPIIIIPLISKLGILEGYKIKPWMSIPKDDMYIIDLTKVITMTEVTDINIIKVYQKFNKVTQRINIDRKMGLISKVDDARRSLEDTYRNS